MTLRKRKVPGLNTTSTADISFMLLIFFLVTTSMNPDKGLSLRLPPPANQENAQMDIKERNVMQVRLDGNGRVMIGDEVIAQNQLKQRAEEFIANAQDNPNLPEKYEKNIKLLGPCMVTAKHVISIQSERGTSYDAYFGVLNELVRAYNELRNQLAVNRFGHTFAACSAEQKEAIRDYYPQKISEAEPVNNGGEPEGEPANNGGQQP